MRNSISRKHMIVFFHNFIPEMLCRKNLKPTTCGCPLQLVVFQFSGSSPGTRYFRSLHLCGQGGCSRERLSPLVFVMVADEIVGGLRPSWERKNFAWTCDEVSFSCLGYADDVLLFSGSKAALEAMSEDCCVKYGEAGLEVRFGQTPLEQFDRDGR